MENASHIHRLRKHKMYDVFDYTFRIDTCDVVPGLEQKKSLTLCNKQGAKCDIYIC